MNHAEFGQKRLNIYTNFSVSPLYFTTKNPHQPPLSPIYNPPKKQYTSSILLEVHNMTQQVSEQALAIIRKMQQNERTESEVYKRIAKFA